jgi:DNA-binding transcriptional ArsR family regulator
MMKALTLPMVDLDPRAQVRSFSRDGFVVQLGDRCDVVVGGSLVWSYAVDDIAGRNMIIAKLAEGKRRGSGLRYGRLAAAFGVSQETVRRVRKRYEKGGLEALARVSRGGRQRVITPRLRKRLVGLFESGHTIVQAHKAIRGSVSRTMVGRVHKQWVDERRASASPGPSESEQTSLSLSDSNDQAQQAQRRGVSERKEARKAAQKPAPQQETEQQGAELAPARVELPLQTALQHGGKVVQHAGSWIMLAMLQALGVYRWAEQHRARAARHLGESTRRFVAPAALRLALDAAIIALCVGERCIEGVRRLGTPSAPEFIAELGAHA